jgi:hypothetical protein
MNPRPAAPPTVVLEQLLIDHPWLDFLLGQVLSALEHKDSARFQKLRREFEWNFLVHLNAEEAFLIPALRLSNERGALDVLKDHRQLRRRFAELTAGVDMESVRLDALCRFMDEVRAHSRRVASLYYQLGAEHVDESQRDSDIRSRDSAVCEQPAQSAA